MTRRDVGLLLVKILGIFILVGAVLGLPWRLQAFAQSLYALEFARTPLTWKTIGSASINSFGATVISIIFGMCLLWWGGRVVYKAANTPLPEEGDAPAEAVDLRSLEISLVALLGLYLLADGLPDVCGFALRFRGDFAIYGATSWSWRIDLPWLVQVLIKPVTGMSLILGRGGAVAILRGARGWVRKMRTWPYKPADTLTP